MNSAFGVASHNASRHVASADVYSRSGLHYVNLDSQCYAQEAMPTIYTLSINTTSNIECSRMYSHALAVEQVHVPMNNYRAQMLITIPFG